MISPGVIVKLQKLDAVDMSMQKVECISSATSRSSVKRCMLAVEKRNISEGCTQLLHNMSTIY